VVGVQSTITVWKPGEEPKPATSQKSAFDQIRRARERGIRGGVVLAGAGPDTGTVIPPILRRDPVAAWVSETGFPKKGRESVRVARSATTLIEVLEICAGIFIPNSTARSAC
jgi:SRSO17 transposase